MDVTTPESGPLDCTVSNRLGRSQVMRTREAPQHPALCWSLRWRCVNGGGAPWVRETGGARLCVSCRTITCRWSFVRGAPFLTRKRASGGVVNKAAIDDRTGLRRRAGVTCCQWGCDCVNGDRFPLALVTAG